LLQQTTQYPLFLFLIQQILNLLTASESMRILIEISKNKFRSFSLFYTISFSLYVTSFLMNKSYALICIFLFILQISVNCFSFFKSSPSCNSLLLFGYKVNKTYILYIDIKEQKVYYY